MTMLEKAARAIKLELYEQEDKARRARKRASIDTHALARAALEAIRGMDSHGIDLNYWSERVVDAILNEETT